MMMLIPRVHAKAQRNLEFTQGLLQRQFLLLLRLRLLPCRPIGVWGIPPGPQIDSAGSVGAADGADSAKSLLCFSARDCNILLKQEHLGRVWVNSTNICPLS